ncbi:adenylate kinase [Saccharothrix sp. S26]|uniref:adenylate kinase n=1 Tax=Saccharothrix sp. S26 TaxID=2907215 RepID=UPI001F170E39|nr:adenylate kinase [Saccharothrix sp. S26]MCE6999001.1 adenylate kinase [Saccharothrix sp. S26]
MTPRRIVVLGASGAGKSTLARELARLVDGPHVELDAIQHGPDWTTPPDDEFRARLAAATEGPAWVADGNLARLTADVLWHRADLIVWLDLPLRVVLPRLARRTASRIARRTELWNGNRETPAFLFSRNSVLVWAVKARRRHLAEYPGRLAAAGVPWVRLRSAAAVARWLAGFSAVSRRPPGTGRPGPASR